MKSKEDLIKKFADDPFTGSLNRKQAERCAEIADEYAKQEAEAYEKWLCDSRYIRKLFPLSAPFADLWELFLESKKQKV